MGWPYNKEWILRRTMELYFKGKRSLENPRNKMIQGGTRRRQEEWKGLAENSNGKTGNMKAIGVF
jgi:hypothetical protein